MVNKQKRSTQGVSKRQRLELEERRVNLLELGKKLFGHFTYDQISITDIAAAAKISKGLLYYYFPNKRVFYVETIRAAASEMLRQSEGRISQDPSEQLRYILEGYLTYVEENASAYLTLMRSGVGVDPEVVEILDQVRSSYCKRVLEILRIEEPTCEQSLVIRGGVGFIEAVSIEWLKKRTISLYELCLLIERRMLPAVQALLGSDCIKPLKHRKGTLHEYS
jgi:AcrR family transcriptional regulator